MNAPIIFIHYNDSKYLKFSLILAKKNNPNEDVILLGDKSNEHYKNLGIKHAYFIEYFNGVNYLNFEESFEYIVGNNFENVTYGKPWTKFNFNKYFALFNYLKSEQIEKFWTFDSDVFIFSELKPFEEQFKDFNYTSWNYIHQLQGFSDITLIEKYCRFLYDIFKNKSFINEQKEDFKKNPNYGFTLMRAFKKFKEDLNLNVINIFDEAYNSYHGLFCHYFVVDNFINDKYYKTIHDSTNLLKKQLYINRFGQFFVQNVNNRTYQPIAVLDTSWLNYYVQKKIFKICLNHKQEFTGYKKFSYSISPIEKILNKIKKVFA